jgi:uncharacterized protein YbjT (DUF2867 family)
MADHTPVAVLGGGGTMGQAMARNLARAGISVRAWNRTRAKAAALADDGVTVTETADDLADAHRRPAATQPMSVLSGQTIRPLRGEKDT